MKKTKEQPGVVKNIPAYQHEKGASKVYDGAFGRCSKLVDAMPESSEKVFKSLMSGAITQIEPWAFFGSTSLDRVVIPENIVYIGVIAFSNCKHLTYVHILGSITYIRYGTFQGCRALSEIIMPESLTRIGKSAFEGCVRLIRMKIPKQVKYIGSRAFKKCVSLKRIVMPNSVIHMEEEAFYGCEGLLQVKLSEKVLDIRDRTFEGCSKLVDLQMHEGLEKIGEKAFASCISLTQLTIPGSVREIGKSAFEVCRGLRQVIVPAHLDLKGTAIRWTVTIVRKGLIRTVLPRSRMPQSFFRRYFKFDIMSKFNRDLALLIYLCSQRAGLDDENKVPVMPSEMIDFILSFYPPEVIMAERESKISDDSSILAPSVFNV